MISIACLYVHTRGLQISHEPRFLGVLRSRITTEKILSNVAKSPIWLATNANPRNLKGPRDIASKSVPLGIGHVDIRRLFSRYGKVQRAAVAMDRRGRSKGYGLIDMPKPAAKKAIHALDGSKLGGRALKTNFSKPQLARR